MFRKHVKSKTTVIRPGVLRQTGGHIHTYESRTIPTTQITPEATSKQQLRSRRTSPLTILCFVTTASLCGLLIIVPHSHAVHRATGHRTSHNASTVDSESESQLTIDNPPTDPLHVTIHLSRVAATIKAQQAPDYSLPPPDNGMAPVLLNIPTAKPVVFLTIDDGAVKDPLHFKLLDAAGLRATLFLADSFIHTNPGFFAQYQDGRFIIENHSREHPLIRHLPYEIQRDQICSEADIQQQQFGRRPQLYRPPGGFYDDNTRRAAFDCGMKAVIMWHAKAESGKMMYQDGDHLLPGDIVLMHFRPEFPQDLAAFIAAQKASGLQTVLLEDWLLGTE